MSRRPALRTLFLMPILVTILAGFSAFAIYVDRVERNNRIADIDAELIRADQFGRPIRPPAGPPPRTPDPGDTLVNVDENLVPIQLLLDSSGMLIASTGAGNPFDESTLQTFAEIDGYHTIESPNYRVLVAQDRRGDTAVTALSLEPVRDATAAFRRAVVVGGVVITLLVVAVLALLIGSLTRPITRLTDAAGRIADGELDTNLDVESRSRELGELGEDLSKMLDRLKGSLFESERSADDARRARDDMERFVADAAHELRTPLTALKGYSDLHAGGMLKDEADVDRAMSRIGSESERLHRLVDDMLALARAGMTDEAPDEPVDVGVVAAEVVADLSAAHPTNQVSASVAPGSHVIMGNRARLHQAVLNLGANACQHGGDGTDVVIDVGSAESSVEVRVIDDGPGIDPADAERIFLPFYRADRSRHRQDGNGGAGLGLALTKQIIESHGGTITIEPNPGGGTVFVVAVPRVSTT